MAIAIVAVLFFIKNTTTFKNDKINTETGSELLYSNETLESLVNKDTDQDGVLDWQESLYGLDPAKKETTPGKPDISAINELKAAQNEDSNKPSNNKEEENLTETEKFSRELFSTIVTLNQTGNIDQVTIDALSTSLSERINNPVYKRVFTTADIKITDNETRQALQKYSDELNAIYSKYHTKKGVPVILQELIDDEENLEILAELDPIIAQTGNIISESLKIQVPRSISSLHLDLINSTERILENTKDMRLFDTDIIVAISAIGQYEKNATALEASANKLLEKINQGLSR